MAPRLKKNLPPDGSGVLIQAVRKLLKPVIKLMISRGITLPTFYQLLKSTYVEVAEEDFALENRRLTDSRISLITGVHRKDVQKLRHTDIELETEPGSISLGTRLVSTWIAGSRYLDSKGNPLVLPIKSDVRSQPSFEKLVQEISRKDLHPRVVLDELVRLGIVSTDDKNQVQLNVEAFVPDSSADEKTWYFGENMATHLATGVHNLIGKKPVMFERSVSYSGLSREDVSQLEKKINSLGVAALKKVNQQALAMKEKREKQGRPGKYRFTFGLFFNKREKLSEQQDVDA